MLSFNIALFFTLYLHLFFPGIGVKEWQSSIKIEKLIFLIVIAFSDHAKLC